MLPEPGSASGPLRNTDERATLVTLAFLCSRLLEVSAEERAAHVLQTQWRRRHRRLPGKRHLTRIELSSSCLSPRDCADSFTVLSLAINWRGKTEVWSWLLQ